MCNGMMMAVTSEPAGFPRRPIVLAAINAKWIHPSLALRLLKANLGPLEDRCEIIEFALRQSLEEKTAIMSAARPDILGFSVSIWNHRATLELLAALENIRRQRAAKTRGGTGKRGGAAFGSEEKRPVIVLGGPEVSHLPEDAEIFGYADYVIRGEGEKAFAKLCQSLLRENQENGTARRRRSAAKFYPAESVDVPDIDPGYRLYTEEDLGKKLIYAESSRGCPFQCAFCHSAAGTRLIREFPLERFLHEMDGLLNRLETARNAGAGNKIIRPVIKFLDRSFNVNVSRALAVMEFFLSRLNVPAAGEAPHSGGTEQPRKDAGHSAGGRFQVHFEMVPAFLPPALKAMIARFPPGTLRLELGVQSLAPGVCAAVQRPSNPEQELENLRFLRTGTTAAVHADLIAGLPNEDFASFGEGFDRLWMTLTADGKDARTAASGGTAEYGGADNKNAPFEIQLGILKGLPGTPLRKLDETYGMLYSPQPPYEVIETATMNKNELDRIKNFTRFWELTVNKPAFADLLSAIAPPGKPVFRRFMELADTLYLRFGRNWGIDRNKLREAVLPAQRPCQKAGPCDGL